jgi:HEAT repeat protein
VKKSATRPVKSQTAPATGAPDDEMAALVEQLGSKRFAVRVKARERLIELGQAAVVPLLQCLNSPVEKARWEAAKALTELRACVAADALVDALADDPSDEVRWAAAEALIALQWEGVKHVLIALLRRDTVYLRGGAHHVLAVFAKRRSGAFLKPVVHLLGAMDSGVTVPLAAQRALESLRTTGPV